jgi:hypothetical protein
MAIARYHSLDIGAVALQHSMWRERPLCPLLVVYVSSILFWECDSFVDDL